MRNWTELLDYSTELKATRKPRVWNRFPGVHTARYAARQYLAVWLQQPPRRTRSEPDSGHGGSSSGEFLRQSSHPYGGRPEH